MISQSLSESCNWLVGAFSVASGKKPWGTRVCHGLSEISGDEQQQKSYDHHFHHCFAGVFMMIIGNLMKTMMIIS